MRDRVIQTLTPVGIAFGMAVPTERMEEQYIGTSRDRLTSIQLIGPADALHRCTMLLGIPQERRAAHFQGKLIVVILALLIPEAPELQDVVGEAIPRLRKKSPIKIAGTPDHVNIELMHVRNQGYMAVRIQWPNKTN
jgi:hypothetical protein